MKLLPNGLAVLENDPWASAWVEEHNSLQYDSSIEQFLKPLLHPGQVAVDVGAYIGGYAGPFFKFVSPGGLVYAFEPNPEPFECLVHNCPQVICHNVAIGSKNALEYYYEDKVNRGASFILDAPSTLVPCREVEVRTLDSFNIEHVRLIKIDVEGMEYEVIRGAEKTIRESLPILFVEINHSAMQRAGRNAGELLALIQSMGYAMHFLDRHHSLDPIRWPQLDVLFKPM